MGFEVEYNQTHTNLERMLVAQDFVRDNKYEFPIRIDPAPENLFNTVFAAWPLRFYVISPDSVMKWIAEPFGDLMIVRALTNYLKDYFESNI